MHLSAIASHPPTPHMALLTDNPAKVLVFAAGAFDAGIGSALVTLVDIRGGAARSLGAQMAVRGDAGYAGFISGGCVEAAVAAEAAEAIARGTDRFLMLGEGSRFFDIVLPCGGGITVAIHVVRESETIWKTVSDLAERKRVGISYNPGSERIDTASSSANIGWHENAFITGYRPKTRIIVCGRAMEADATGRVAMASDFEVVKFEWDQQLPPSAIDDDTAVALLQHDLDREMPVLEAALKARPFYIGALGSSRTHDRRADRLIKLGYTATDIARIKAPIGLFPKARDAASLAISVVADISAARM